VGIASSQLIALEAESIHIIRESVAESNSPALLFSGGKDSAVMLHLAVKAFLPGRLPVPVVHVDTGHNFQEVIEFRDQTIDALGLRLVVASVEQALAEGKIRSNGQSSRNRLQTPVLLSAIAENKFDALFGGARRDEEKARAKERVFSFRDDFGQWDPKNQRPEVWALYNGHHHPGEHIRVFPLSNWTELDVWHYIREESILLPSIYFAHRRKVFLRDGALMAAHPLLPTRPGEEVFEAFVRYRTVGDLVCTGAVESNAATVDEVIKEIAASRITERGQTRVDDRSSDTAMEDRKREGYF
jgi:sulfate adenylyltransferase subunit 2